MNKLIKLPLFLGVTGCLCGGILALTNHFTSQKIKADEEDRKNAAYIEHFENLSKTNEATVSDALTKAGVTQKIYAFDSSKAFIGSIYSCEAVGYAGPSSPIKFSISFKNGQPNHYVSLGHGESAQGKAFMDWLAGDKSGDRLGNLDAGKVESGSSVSYGAVKKAVDACIADILAEAGNTPTYEEGK